LKIFEKIINKIPNIAPIQKAKMSDEPPKSKPKSQPIPNANFPSPKPIHFPREINHKRKKGRKNKGPAQKFIQKKKSGAKRNCDTILMRDNRMKV
jgi:hypothetical protein